MKEEKIKLTFTKTFIYKNKGCYTKEKVDKLSFINNKIIIIEDILNSEIPYKDKIYFLWINGISYKEKVNIYDNSIKIRNIFKKYYSSNGMVGFYDSYSYYYFSSGLVAITSEKNTIIKEILKYIKKYREINKK